MGWITQPERILLDIANNALQKMSVKFSVIFCSHLLKFSVKFTEILRTNFSECEQKITLNFIEIFSKISVKFQLGFSVGFLLLIRITLMS